MQVCRHEEPFGMPAPKFLSPEPVRRSIFASVGSVTPLSDSTPSPGQSSLSSLGCTALPASPELPSPHILPSPTLPSPASPNAPAWQGRSWSDNAQECWKWNFVFKFLKINQCFLTPPFPSFIKRYLGFLQSIAKYISVF